MQEDPEASPVAEARLVAASVHRVFSEVLRFLPFCRIGCGSKPFGIPFLGVVGAPPILEPILVGIGMFTGGTGF